MQMQSHFAATPAAHLINIHAAGREGEAWHSKTKPADSRVTLATERGRASEREVNKNENRKVVGKVLGKTQRTVQGSNYGLSNGTDIAKAEHKKQAKQQEEEWKKRKRKEGRFITSNFKFTCK